MNAYITGHIIKALRKEKNMTQEKLASRLSLSEKTISKWECGQGCPDITLLPALSKELGVDIGALIKGEMAKCHYSGANQKRLRYYLCPYCGNFVTSTNTITLSCCGRTLEKAEKSDEKLLGTFEDFDGEVYITLDHEMSKEHHLSALIILSPDRYTVIRLFAESDPVVALDFLQGKKIYALDNENHLMEVVLTKKASL